MYYSSAGGVAVVEDVVATGVVDDETGAVVGIVIVYAVDVVDVGGMKQEGSKPLHSRHIICTECNLRDSIENVKSDSGHILICGLSSG